MPLRLKTPRYCGNIQLTVQYLYKRDDMNNNFRRAALIPIFIGAVFVMSSCGMQVTIPDEYNYDLSEYLKLGNYKGLVSNVKSDQVKDGDVEEYIQTVLEQSKTTKEVKSGTVTDTSTVDISYVGKIDGKEFDGGSGQASLDIDNSNFIDGFAEGIIGHDVGETFDIDVVFPDDYANDDVAGKPAVFTVTVNSMQEDVIPEYNDEFVKNNTNFETTKEYEEDIKKTLKAENEQEDEKNIKLDLFNQISDASEVIKYPKEELDNRYNKVIEAYANAAESSGVSLDEYLSTEYGLTEKEFKENAKSSAEETVKDELILRSIADKEGIKVGKSEYGEYLEKIIKDAGYTKETFKSENGISIEEYADVNNLYTSCLYQKVMDKVIEYCE